MRFIKELLARSGTGNDDVNGNGSERRKPLFEANPYLNARRQWNSHIDRAFADKHIWQLAAVACLLIALASVAGFTIATCSGILRPASMQTSTISVAT